MRCRPLSGRIAYVYGALVVVATLSVACLARPARAQGVPYKTRVTVRGDTSLQPVLLSISRLQQTEGKPPESESALRRRVDRDLAAFSALLRSEGYYDHAIRYRFDTDPPPTKVRINVETGPAYRLVAFDVVLHGQELESAMEAVSRARKQITLGGRGRAKAVVDAEDEVLRELARGGFPYPRRVDREVVVDHAARSLSVRTVVDAGRRAHFGETTIERLEGPLTEYVKRRVPWKPGDLYDPRAVDTLRTRLSETRLFSSVGIRPSGEVLDDGTLPVVLDLNRAKVRSIGLGFGYSTSEGVGGRVFWEHRDLFGQAERLRITGKASQIGQSGTLMFRRPDFVTTDQDLVFESAYEVETTEAYDARIFSSSLGLERPLGGYWRGYGGGTVRTGPVDEARRNASDGTRRTDTRDVLLVGIPLRARRDSSDSILDPTEGTRLDLSLTTYSKELGADASFLVGKAGGTAYWPLLKDRRLVAAGRAVLGSIAGAGRFVVPADQRFYAGGGGSVRGFGYQMAGPLDDQHDPKGGRSLIELSTELRWRFTQNFGLVPFVDAGGVYADEYPSFKRELFWGAGLGLRYLSPVGPIRVDVATPLNPRSGVDDPVQFYISLGQAY